MKYATINPVNNELVQEFELDPFPDLNISLGAYKQWRKLTVEERGAALRRAAVVLEKGKRKYAELITLEMGKPIAEAEYEISKVLSGFDYYIKNSAGFLKDELVVTNSIPLSPEAAASKKIRVLSVAGLLAETILRISNEDSVSSLFME